MKETKTYLILDTETATLPFLKSIAKGDDKKETTISTTKPLVYDIGWHLWNEAEGIHEPQHFIISEIYDAPQLFETAYYKVKRPLYEESIANGEVEKVKWETAITHLIEACEKADIVTAYNAEFDFKRAIPFTESFLKARSGKFSVYQQWLEGQRKSCEWLIKTDAERKAIDKRYKETVTILREDSKRHNNFELRGKTYPMGCIYVQSCKEWLKNDVDYKVFCIENGQMYKNVNGFRGNAEGVYQFISGKHSFVEDHMAYSDTCIETDILSKLLEAMGHDLPTGLDVGGFPTTMLGTPKNFCLEQKKVDLTMKVIEKCREYLGNPNNPQCTMVNNIATDLETAVKGW